MAKLIKKVLRCWHDFPGMAPSYTTNERPPSAFKIGSHIVCLDCGYDLPHDWDQVSVPSQIPSRYEAMAALASGVAES
jgi:hypothetical protein